MHKILTLITYLFILTTHSQEIDSVLIRLQSEYKKANTDESKLKKILSLGKYLINRNLKQAESYFNEGIAIINNNKNHESFKADLHVQLGVVYRRKAVYDTSLNYYLKALKYYESINDTSRIADVYHNKAVIYRYQKEHRKAIRNYKKAIRLKEIVKDTLGQGAGYNMLGVSYRQNKQLDSAFLSFQKAKSLYNSIHSEKNIQRVINNMGVYYTSMGEYDKAIEIQKENIRRCKKQNKLNSLCLTYYNLSGVYKKTKDYSTSLIYADSSLQIAKQENFKERIAKSYLRKSFLNRKLKDYKNAYNDYRKFNRCSDSIFNIENAKKIQALELGYEFNKEKERLALLNKAERAKKRFYFILFLTLLISAITIGILLKNNYSQKIKITKIEFEKQQETLNKQLSNKEKEIKQLIADNTMRLAFKEELINTIKTEVINKDPIQIKTTLNSLITQLNLQVGTEKKLDGLQEKISEVNQDFDNILRDKYPKLTKGEREVCALLRLNLSIKEIMIIRNVSVDSVKSMRRRIRKKINISSDTTLENFIKSLIN